MSIWGVLRDKIETYKNRRTASRTVRFMFPALLSSAAALGLLALTGGTQDSYIYLDAPKQAVEVGDLVPVTIYASAAVPVNAVELTVSFPEDKLDVFGVDRGQSVITIWTEDPVVNSNSVQMRGGTFKRGFLGDHQIATINFRAEKSGQYSISVEDVQLIAGDGEGTVVAAVTKPEATISLFNFDESTSEEELKVAVAKKVSTDLNNDGKVTLQDISAFMGAWSNRSGSHDFDGDGRMTFRDFSIILAEFFLK